MTPQTITVQGQRITVDLLVWRRYRSRAVGIVEQVLGLNPGLSALGPYLPIGTVVLMPVIDPATTTAPVNDVVRLWS